MGSRQWGFGEGSVIIEPYLAGGLRWRELIVQADVRGSYFTYQQPGELYRHVAYNVAVSHDFSGSPLAWSAGLELNGSGTALGLTPFVVKGLTRTGSLTGAVGVRLPIRTPFPRSSIRLAGLATSDGTSANRSGRASSVGRVRDLFRIQ